MGKCTELSRRSVYQFGWNKHCVYPGCFLLLSAEMNFALIVDFVIVEIVEKFEVEC